MINNGDQSPTNIGTIQMMFDDDNNFDDNSDDVDYV